MYFKKIRKVKPKKVHKNDPMMKYIKFQRKFDVPRGRNRHEDCKRD